MRPQSRVDSVKAEFGKNKDGETGKQRLQRKLLGLKKANNKTLANKDMATVKMDL